MKTKTQCVMGVVLCKRVSRRKLSGKVRPLVWNGKSGDGESFGCRPGSAQVVVALSVAHERGSSAFGYVMRNTHYRLPPGRNIIVSGSKPHVSFE